VVAVVSAEGIAQAFKQLADAVNSSEEAREKIKRWLEGYYGKIHAFKIGDKEFHLIFYPDGAVKFVEGPYHAPDLWIITDPESWEKLVTMQARWTDLLKEGKMTIIGAANEMLVLTELVMATGVIPLG